MKDIEDKIYRARLIITELSKIEEKYYERAFKKMPKGTSEDLFFEYMYDRYFEGTYDEYLDR